MNTTASLGRPHEINASTMVIRSARGRWRHVLDAVLTVLAWAFFIFLFARGIQAVLADQREGVDLPLLSQLMPTFSDLGVYVLAMLLQGALLLIWARYNYWRFRGKQRRASAQVENDDGVLRYYGIQAGSLQRLRVQPVSVIHHAHDGSIVHISDQDLDAESELPLDLTGGRWSPDLSRTRP